MVRLELNDNCMVITNGRSASVEPVLAANHAGGPVRTKSLHDHQPSQLRQHSFTSAFHD